MNKNDVLKQLNILILNSPEPKYSPFNFIKNYICLDNKELKKKSDYIEVYSTLINMKIRYDNKYKDIIDFCENEFLKRVKDKFYKNYNTKELENYIKEMEKILNNKKSAEIINVLKEILRIFKENHLIGFSEFFQYSTLKANLNYELKQLDKIAKKNYNNCFRKNEDCYNKLVNIINKIVKNK